MRVKKIILKILVFLTIISVFVLIPHAQTTSPAPLSDDTGVSIPWNKDEKIKVGLFEMTYLTDLTKFGVLRLAVFITTFFIAWLFIYAIFNLVRFAYNYIQVEGGDVKQIYEGIRGAEGTMRAVGFTLFMIFMYAAVGVFLGVGNPLKWANKVAQCGNGEFLFRAEYRAQTVNPEIFEKEALIYCCTKLPGLELNETEKAISIGGHEDDAAIVGSAEDGGWLFIGDANAGIPNAVPFNITGAEGCEPFTI